MNPGLIRQRTLTRPSWLQSVTTDEFVQRTNPSSSLLTTDLGWV